MNITIEIVDGVTVAVVEQSPLIDGEPAALDLLSAVWEKADCHRVAISKACLPEEFFDLSTRVAGLALQKFVNYGVKLAIWGDFSMYQSKSLRDFIYESNKGDSVFFVDDKAQAVDRLSRA